MVEQFSEFKELKNIDKTTMISVLEESFRNVLAKMFGTDENLDVILNPDKGFVQIFQNLTVVPDGEVDNPNLQISLSDARADDDPEAEVGEEHSREIIFEKFGRRAILNLRQTLQSRILDLQKEAVYAKFKDLEGELVTGVSDMEPRDPASGHRQQRASSAEERIHPRRLLPQGRDCARRGEQRRQQEQQPQNHRQPHEPQLPAPPLRA